MPLPLIPIAIAASALGSAYSSARSASEERRRTREGARQFNVGNAREFEIASRQRMLDEAAQANTLRRQMDLAPLRDRVQFQLMARAGLSPGAFKPRDLFNPLSNPTGQPQQGGINLNALQAQVADYRPGQGGATTSLQEALLRQMGYTGGPTSYSFRQPFGAQDYLNRMRSRSARRDRGLYG